MELTQTPPSLPISHLITIPEVLFASMPARKSIVHRTVMRSRNKIIKLSSLLLSDSSLQMRIYLKSLPLVCQPHTNRNTERKKLPA